MIISNILVDIIATLDHRELFNQSTRRKHVLLIDGHGSCFKLPFVKYVTHKNHEWIVRIGVPYGTSLWQVGDSSEQNGSYNMALSKAKQYLIDLKQKKMMIPTIQPYEIIILVNRVWSKSFGRPTTNRTAIANRGWFPLNRALLLNKTIRITMTKEEKIAEHESTSVFVPHSYESINAPPPPPSTYHPTATNDSPPPSSTNHSNCIHPPPPPATLITSPCLHSPHHNLSIFRGG